MENLEEFHIPEDALEKIKDPDLLKEQIREGKSLMEILGYNDRRMEVFSQAAETYFYEQNYEKASEAFTFLTALDPNTSQYWLGLGMTEQLLGEYHGALLAYTMVLINQPQNPLVHYHIGNCYQAILDEDNARLSFEMAVKYADEQQEFQIIKEQAQKALDRGDAPS